MSDSSDVLYKDYFENYIIQFCRLCSGETTLTALSPIIELLKTSQILQYLMIDPSNESAKACVREYMATHQNVNSDFLAKFLAIVSVKINIAPTSVGYVNNSYTAKVIYNNTLPTTKLTNITIQTRLDQLREDSKTAVEYAKANRMPPQTIKIKMTDNTLPMCLNAIGDLNRTIVEGNRAYGREMNNFVKTVAK
ncbi:GrBNV gp75-like protein [Tomelloso virus]|uniref:GrBNV gp75-like protein n=1 Tax=Tomelloso virus TaxID=2053981 RepID=A0A2H4T2U5_9VIRU|nr:GrBNV gp75-like protein [Tomelloso virus]ATY70242.1 GrBNV gp75-like protein [Tomelloso virus]